MGGLLSSLKMYPFMDRGNIQDANKAINSGTCWLTSAAANIPVADYCMMVVFYTNNQYIIQLLYLLNQKFLYIRRSIDNGSIWSDWVKIV